MSLVFSGLMYAFLGVFLVVCLLGAAVIATGVRDAVRNRSLMIRAQEKQRKRITTRNLVAIKKGGRK